MPKGCKAIGETSRGARTSSGPASSKTSPSALSSSGRTDIGWVDSALMTRHTVPTAGPSPSVRRRRVLEQAGDELLGHKGVGGPFTVARCVEVPALVGPLIEVVVVDRRIE